MCCFKRSVSSPFSMPSSRKDCLPRVMLSSPILNGISRYLLFPFSHLDAKYRTVLDYSHGANLWLGLQITWLYSARVRSPLWSPSKERCQDLTLCKSTLTDIELKTWRPAELGGLCLRASECIKSERMRLCNPICS